jgi:phage virion morphogenesis protein
LDKPTIQVDAGRATVALGKFRLSLRQNREMMQEIANSQLQSIYKTFDEEGSPSGSWLPLSPNTIRRDPKLYGAGHKLLIKSGYLRNSINAQVRPGLAILAAPARYAAVHQFGSRDRSAAIGPPAPGIPLGRPSAHTGNCGSLHQECSRQGWVRKSQVACL